MTMKRLAVLISISLVACGGSDRTSTNPNIVLDGGVTGTFQVFTPVTRGATYVDDGQGYKYNLSLMATDATGVIGCSLTDPSARPGQAVSRVSFTLLSYAGERAPTCSPQAQAIGSKAVGVFEKAVGTFERWDPSGTKTDVVQAIGGAASFASSSAGSDLLRCDVTVTLSFPGGVVFTDSFSFNYNSQGAIPQSCIHGEACSCESWQTCNAQKQCVNLACIPSQAACPASGSVACCAGSGSCTGGKCCVDYGNPCSPSANDCCYSCDYLNNNVFQGYYCTHP